MTRILNIPFASLILALLPAAAVLAGLIPLIAFATSQGGVIGFDAHTLGVLRFTLLQAALSTALSVIPAIFVARALARQDFPGKDFVLALLALPLSLPVIVAILGIAQVFGAAGWLGGFFDLYGLTGILIAHVFFNLPLATRIFYEAQAAIPTEAHRLAAQLDLTGLSHFHVVEWPYLKPAALSASALIFLLCTASFVIVLTLGGGPSASTLEVAIYQSLRLDFDLARAVTLSFIQIALCAVLISLISQSQLDPSAPPLRLDTTRFDGKSAPQRLTDMAMIAIALLVILPPLAAVIAAGFSGFEYAALLPQALATSIGIGVTAAMTTLAIAWHLARLAARHPSLSVIVTLCTLAGLIVPPAVIATGWFIAVRSWSDSLPLALAMIVALNALMALPFASSVLRPAIARHVAAHDRLCAQLGLSGWKRLRIIDWPALKRPVLQALLMAFVLSLGDLTAVTLLGSNGIVTLPSLISQQMGNYRSAAAGGTALLLASLCYALTLAAQRMGRST